MPASTVSASLQRAARVLVALEWLWLLLLLPVILLLRPSLSPILLLLPLIGLLRWAATGVFVPRTPLNLALLVLLFMLLVSVYATPDLTFSLLKIGGLLYGVALFFGVVATIGNSEKRLLMGVGVLLAMAVIVVVVGLLTVEWSPEVPGLQPLVTGASGVQTVLPVVNPNEVAGVLLWVTPLAVALAARSLSASFYSALPVPVPRVLLAPATVLIASITTAVLVMTRSRSALLGLAAGAFFLGLVALRGRRVLQALAALALAFILAAPLFFFREQSAGLVRAVFGSASVNGGDLFQRVEIWQRALYGLEDFFLTGMGIGTFRHVVHVLYPLFSPSQQVDIGHAHNHLLQAGLDLGIPGLIAYTALWLITARMLLQTWQTSRSAWLRLLGAGFAGSLLAYFIFGVTDAVALGARPGFIFWYLLGLVASLHQIARVAG